MFERDFEKVRSITKHFKTAGYDKACARTTKLASGTYNEVFVSKVPVDGKDTEVIARLSFYNNASIKKMNRIIEDCKKTEKSFEEMKGACKRIKEQDPVQIKINMGWLSNFFITRDVSPHFVYMYNDFDCKKMHERLNADVDPASVARYAQQNEMGKVYNNISFHEKFDTDLSKLLIEGTMGELELKCVLFQVIYTLATLQHYVPDFRHNDLSCQNILVKRVEPRPGSAYAYELYDKTFYLPGKDATVFGAIYDFDLTHASSHVMHVDRKHPEINLRNDVIQSGRFLNYKEEDVRTTFNAAFNPSFDMHYFLYTVAYFLQRSGGNARNAAGKFPPSRLYPNIQKWLVSMGVMPDVSFDMGRKMPRYIGYIDARLIPVNLLSAPFFASLAVKPRTDAVVRTFGIKRLPIQVVHESTLLSWKKPEIVHVQTDRPPVLYSAKPRNSGGRKLQVFDFDPGSRSSQPLQLFSVFSQENIYPNLIPSVFVFDTPDSITRLDAALIHKACADLNPGLLRTISDKFSINRNAFKSPKDLCAIITNIMKSRFSAANDRAAMLTSKHRCSLFFEKSELVSFAKEQGIPESELYVNLPTGQKVLKRKQDICEKLRLSLL
jgi:hypothetical protein